MTLWYCKTEYTGKAASDAVRRLLEHAFFLQYGGELPRIEKTPGGKPFFPERPGVHFSLSHSCGHLLCALGDSLVGCDIQQRRRLRRGTEEKLSDAVEREEFEFFELWCLRESLFKLTDGASSLRSARFRRENGLITAPEHGVACRTYGDIAGCACALCTVGDVPAGLNEVSAALLFDQI